MRTYGEDDNEVDWITAGILWVGVTPLDKREPRYPRMIMAVTGVYIGDFGFETVWIEYFHHKYE